MGGVERRVGGSGMSRLDIEDLMNVGERAYGQAVGWCLHGRISGKSDIIAKNNPGSASVG